MRVCGAVLVGVLIIASSCSSSPYAPESVPYVDVSIDGRFAGAVTQGGELRVWELETRELVLGPDIEQDAPGMDELSAAHFVTFWGGTSRVLWDCGYGRVCWHDLDSGEGDLLLEHDAGDTVFHGLTSADGTRMVFGTEAARVFTFDPETGEQRTKKHQDTWSPHRPFPIYTLEGTRDLDVFLSATASITAAAMYQTHPEAILHKDEGYLEMPSANGGYFVAGMYDGITIWPWGEGEPRLIDDDFSDKVRADFSLNGRLLAINEEGGDPYEVYEVSSLAKTRDLSASDASNCNGLRFLDADGHWLGVVSYWNDGMAAIDLQSEAGTGIYEVHDIPLRDQPAGGPRIMAALPEKGWVFIGLARGGVDWYRFRPGDPPSLDHIATLK